MLWFASHSGLDSLENPSQMEAIVVSFNSGRSLVTCCRALLKEGHVDCVQVMDNTPDGTDAKALQAALGTEARIGATASGANLGFGRAVNTALRRVESAHVAIVNPDGIVGPGTLDKLVAVLNGQPEAVLAGGRLLDANGREQQGSRRREPTPGRLIVNTLVRALRLRPWYRFGFEMSDAPLPPGPVVVDAVSGACMVARTAALRAIGGFDERFFLHFEDLDLCKRMRDAGGRILFVPDAVFCHEGGGSSRSRPYFVIWHKHLSMVKYYWKHYRRIGAGGLWLPLIISVAAGRCLGGMFRSAWRNMHRSGSPP